MSEEDLLKYIVSCLNGECISGMVIDTRDFKDTILELLSNGVKLYYLHEDGVPIKEVLPEMTKLKNVGFIVGDQDGLKIQDEKLLDELNIKRVSLGSIPYLSWYCVVLINYYLDLTSK